MIEKRVDSKGNVTKLVVRKPHNPKTGHRSGIRHDFSSAGWNQVTLDYFESIKNLSGTRLADIFDEAKGLVTKGVKQSTKLRSEKSDRADLQSDVEGLESIGLQSISLLLTLLRKLS
jgi:hypothetical protein